MMKTQKRVKYFAAIMILNISFEIISPTVALALTNGPMQPEYQNFEPANSSEMVDLFTGNFKYNIPIMDVDGYPLNLAYHAGSNVESEAGWVGLGWSLNPGVLNRLTKGLPDDFNGDQVYSETKMKPNVTAGEGSHHSTWRGKYFGLSDYGFSIGDGSGTASNNAYISMYNNYKGYGFEEENDSHFSLTQNAIYATFNQVSSSGTKHSSQDGGSFSDSYTNSNSHLNGRTNVSVGEGTNYNTRNGAITKTYSYSGSKGVLSNFQSGKGMVTSIPSGMVSYQPRIPFDFIGGGMSRSNKSGFWGQGSFSLLGLTYCYSGGELDGNKIFDNSLAIFNNTKSVNAYGFLYSENADESSLMDFNRYRDVAILEETPNASFASSTYDLFFASAQGMTSSFRPFRSDIGEMHDPTNNVIGGSYHTGSEVGKGLFYHSLDEYSTIDFSGSSKRWSTALGHTIMNRKYSGLAVPTTSNGSATDFNIAAKKSFVEKYYFKRMGELTERDEDFENSINSDQCVSPTLLNVGADYYAFSPISGEGRKKRDKRTDYIESLTAEQASSYGLEQKISLYDRNSFSINASTKAVVTSTNSQLININRTTKTSTLSGLSNYSIKDHISEVSITNSQGERYVYGIPSYNLTKKNVIFNASSRVEPNYLSYGTSVAGALQHYPDPTSYSYTPLPASDNYQLVQYDPADISSNSRGLDNLSRTEKTPAYASSFLLTAIVSSDYVDISGNGPSYDDFGSFTKFNYSKENDYQWRQPFCLNPANSGTLAGAITTNSLQAQYEKGIACDELDDKAFYEYGIRENYYVHSIETKNFVAVFRTSGRKDGLGVLSENGEMGAVEETFKLDAVELYSKNEIVAKQGIANAIPIKTVHFEYDYTLCGGTFNTLTSGNTTHGKLTLKKVYFTYGKSNLAALSPYEFKYADNDHNVANGDENNFNYDPMSIDRWGSYKPNTGAATGISTVSTLNNIEFPYAEQNKQLADKYAAAWNLTEIKTPTGSTIKITYEADDYAYVQNKKAAQMLKIYDLFSSTPNPSTNVLTSYGSNTVSLNSGGHYLIVDLKDMSAGIPSSASLNDANDYLRSFVFNSPPFANDQNIYFKCFLKVAGPECGAGIDKNYFDYISGYGMVEESGLFDASIPGNTYYSQNVAGTNSVSCYRFAYLRLSDVIAYDSKNVSVISNAGWDFLRSNAPRIAYPGSEPANIGDPTKSPLQQSNNASAGLEISKVDMENALAKKPNKRFFEKRFCDIMYPAKSFVRGYSANSRKIGGGYRVKQITTEDNWANMTTSINSSGYNENSTTYGQTFEYTKIENGNIISSGVASYEPIQGGDEISLHNIIPFEIKKQFAPNDHFFQESPLGEAIYPSPVVGYSKVTMKALPDPNAANVCKNGKTEFEFYTAKDFPISDITSKLSKQVIEKIPEEATIKNFIKRLDNPSYEARKIYHTAQGNVLKFNDMHGKLRSVSNYGEDNSDSPVSKIEYFYKCTQKENGFELMTSAMTLNEKNVISSKIISRDIDVTADTRENMSYTQISGFSDLFEVGLVVSIAYSPPYVIIGPSPPATSSQDLLGNQTFGYRGATITKVVQEYGILEKIESTLNGAKTITENLLWDSNTGNVLLTKVTNQLDQPVYNFNYPAYWAYPEMGHEFMRDGIALDCPSPSSVSSPSIAVWDPVTGHLDLTAISDPEIFKIGDEVCVTDKTANVKIGQRFWIIRDPNNTAFYLLVDQSGKALNTTNYSTSLQSSHNHLIKLINPINKNKIDASMGGVVSLSDPRIASTISYTPTNQKIIDAYAQEYCAGSSVFVNYGITQQSETNVPSDFYLKVGNPIIAGIYGDFKPTYNYKYKTVRSYGAQPSVKSDGFYSSFSPFWFYDSGSSDWRSIPTNSCAFNIMNNEPSTLHGNWRVFGKSSYYSPYGQLIQSQNAIGINSAQRFGFQHTLPTLQASNARVDEVGFDSFEEYAITYPFLNSISSTTANICNNDYLGFYSQTGGTNPTFTNSAAHMGRNSLMFGPNQTVSLKHSVESDYFERPRSVYMDAGDYCACMKLSQVINCSRLNLNFKPYVISLWIKGLNPSTDYSNLITLSVKQTHTVSISGTSSQQTYTTNVTPAKSPVINGWQKLDYEITVSPQSTGTLVASAIEFNIKSGSTGGFYLDDFRIQPFNSSMTCNVYDPYQLRLWAQMDDRNYATIYEYDNEGNLVRKKKETLNSIYTLQEVRSGNPKR